MAKKRKLQADGQAEPVRGGTKSRRGGAQVIPLPEHRSDSDFELSDEDLEFVQQHAQSAGFLLDLPTGQLDRAVSHARAKQQQADKQKQPAKQEQQQQQPRSEGSSDEEDQGISDQGLEEDSDVSSLQQSDNEEEAEAWERRPRSLPQGVGQTGPAAELPVKSLDGRLLFGKQRQQENYNEGEGEQDAGPQLPLAVSGVTIQDDLQEQRRQKEAAWKEAAAEAAAAAEADASRARQRQQQQGAKDKGGREGLLQQLAAYQSQEQRREAARQQMAVVARALLADPQGQLKQLRPLLALLKDEDLEVRRLALLTLLAVLLDIMPGYRIRPPTEKELEINVSAEVRKQREHESALLSAYQSYLKALLEPLRALKGAHSKSALGHARTAVRCMARLLTGLPHFNYTSDLLQALVPCMAHRDDQIQQLASAAITHLLASDVEGGVAAEAVQLVADLVRRRKCVAPPSVVTSLLGLRFSQIASAADFAEAQRSRKKDKKKKGGKKGAKDEVDRAFLEAQAHADLAAQRANQSATLEALFEIFFRVLKACTASGLLMQPGAALLTSSRCASRFPLLLPALEGLSKYAHLLSVEYFTDIAAVLLQLVGSTALPAQHRLRCLLTAAEMLQGQAEALTVDRSGFYTGLYSSLLHTPLQPLGEEQEEGDDAGEGRAAAGKAAARPAAGASPQQQPAGQASSAAGASGTADSADPGVLLARVLEAMLLDTKALDALRQAAFAKRMCGAAAAAGDSGAALGVLHVMHRMIRRQPRLRSMLENEAGGPPGQRTFSPDVEDPAEAGALAAPLWELALLSQHYHPSVADSARSVAGMADTRASSQPAGLPLASSAAELAALYSTAAGGFRPPPAAPRQRPQGKAPGRLAKQGAGSGLLLEEAAEAEFVEGLATEAGSRQEQAALAGGEADEAEVEGALGQHFTQRQLHVRNSRLNSQQAALALKLRRFHVHLQQRQQQDNSAKRRKG